MATVGRDTLQLELASCAEEKEQDVNDHPLSFLASSSLTAAQCG